MSDVYRQVRVKARDAGCLEIALAEAWNVGAAGAEEAPDGCSAVVFVLEARATELAAAVNAVEGAEASAPAAVADVAWSDAWKEGLGPVVISPRLCVRSPFVQAPEGFEGAEIVIEPAQAFGTGHHASTRLALEWLDAERAQLAGARVLDIGCGSGVLALAAVALGAGQALAHDLDPLAGSAAGQAVSAHGERGRVWIFTGTTEALSSAVSGSFDGVIANMIRSELEPLLAEVFRLTREGGWLIASGLLAHERERFEASLGAAGFEVSGSRSALDGGDEWLAFRARRARRRRSGS